MPRTATHAARSGAATRDPQRAAARREASRTRRAAEREPRVAGATRARGGTARRNRAGAVRATRTSRAVAREADRSPSARPRAVRSREPGLLLRLPVRSAHGLLDGLLRGRTWVAFIGVLLVGIVFLNVSLLGLNSGIAVTADQAAELRRQNAELRLEVAKLGSSERIQEVAESRGFVMPAPGDVAYVEVDPDADGPTAAAALEKVAAAAPAADPMASAEESVAAEPTTGTRSEPAPADVAGEPAPVDGTATDTGVLPEADPVAGDAPESPDG